MTFKTILCSTLVIWAHLALGYGEPSSIAFQYDGSNQMENVIGAQVFITQYVDRVIIDTCWNGPYSYPCQRVVRVPISVFDHEVNSFLTLHFDETANLSNGGFFKHFYNQAVREELTFINDSKNPNILALAKLINFSNDRFSPQYERHTITITTKFSNFLKETLSPLLSPIKDLQAEDKILSFNISKINDLKFFFVHLKISQRTTFSEKVVFNDIIPNDALELSPFGNNKTMVMIDLDNFLDEIESGKKYTIEATVGLDLDGYFIMNEQYSNLPLSRSSTLKTVLN